MPRGPKLYRDPLHKDKLELRNGRLQFKWILHLFNAAQPPFILTPEIVKELHFLAIKDIYACAGNYRTRRVKIEGSPHRPPDARYVAGLVEGACEKVRDNPDWNPIRTASYLMWRLNWIHPFEGGNGRTSRAVAYLAFCVNIGFVPEAKLTFSELIDKERLEYLAALRDADDACSAGVLDTRRMEALLDRLLRGQLLPFWGGPTL